MSHFITLVLVPPDSTHIERAVSALLAPYNEEITVAPYKTDCYCINTIAYHAGIEASNRVEQVHPFYQQPNPDCEDCQGSGQRWTTYNPAQSMGLVGNRQPVGWVAQSRQLPDSGSGYQSKQNSVCPHHAGWGMA